MDAIGNLTSGQQVGITYEMSEKQPTDNDFNQGTKFVMAKDKPKFFGSPWQRIRNREGIRKSRRKNGISIETITNVVISFRFRLA